MICILYDSMISQEEVAQLKKELQKLDVALELPTTLSFSPDETITIIFSILSTFGPSLASDLLSSVIVDTVKSVVRVCRSSRRHMGNKPIYFQVEYGETKVRFETNITLTEAEQDSIIEKALETITKGHM